MVHELGFKEEDVKWALKITDTGEGIDANAAVALLTREQERYEQRRSGRFAFRSKSPSLLESVITVKSRSTLAGGGLEHLLVNLAV